MIIVKPSFTILPQSPGLNGMKKLIEIAGRTCYRSEDKIISDSSEEFYQRMINLGHLAMLEHGTVYLHFPAGMDWIYAQRYLSNPHSKVVVKDAEVFVTTNPRVLIENEWLPDLDYWCEPTPFHERRVAVKFNTQIAISREYNRHRVDSIAEESTRNCGYNRDRFDGQLSISLPHWINMMDIKPEQCDLASLCGEVLDGEAINYWTSIDYWIFSNLVSEFCYMGMTRLGTRPEDARTVLPLDLNTNLVHTAFVSDWKHFFSLRTANSAHPDARFLAANLEAEFYKEGILND